MMTSHVNMTSCHARLSLTTIKEYQRCRTDDKIHPQVVAWQSFSLWQAIHWQTRCNDNTNDWQFLCFMDACYRLNNKQCAWEKKTEVENDTPSRQCVLWFNIKTRFDPKGMDANLNNYGKMLSWNQWEDAPKVTISWNNDCMWKPLAQEIHQTYHCVLRSMCF